MSQHDAIHKQKKVQVPSSQDKSGLQRAAVNSTPLSPEHVRSESERALQPNVNDVLSAPGQPLDDDTRAFMEPRFEHDFSHVRVHTDSQAAESARSLNALAYTVGNDIVFGAGQYVPETTAGEKTIAHELTHVVQQASGPVTGIPIGNGLAVSDPSDNFEQAAHNVANTIVREPPRKSQDMTTSLQPSEAQMHTSTRIQRQEDTSKKDDTGTSNERRSVLESIDLSNGSPPPPPVLEESEQTGAQGAGTMQTLPASSTLNVIQLQGGPGEVAAAFETAEKVAKGFEILKSATETITKGDFHAQLPSSTIGVRWTDRPRKLHLTTIKKDSLIFDYSDVLVIGGIEACSIKLRCNISYNGPEIEASFTFDADGMRSRLLDDTDITVGQPLSIDRRQTSAEWKTAGVYEYPVVDIPIRVSIDRPWPLDNDNYTFTLVLSGMYGFGAAPGEDPIQKLVHHAD